MTRKDYVALAEALRRVKPLVPIDTAEGRIQYALAFQRDLWEATVESVQMTLAADNPRFDADRFRTACRG